MFNDKTTIGLEIGSYSIKIVELKQTPEGYKLLTFGLATHSLDLSSYWHSNKLKQLSIIIEELLEVNKFTGLKTIMGISSKDVYVTSMDFDSVWSKNQIQTEIEKQSKYFLPYSTDEVHLSWKLVDSNSAINEYTSKQRVSITALPDFVIDNSRNLLEQINLDGISLENQTISQVRSLLTGDTGNTILADIGANQTTFNIIVGSQLRSSSHIPIGANQITRDLAASLGVEEAVAELFKNDLHLVNLFKLPKALTDYYKILKSELTTFIELNNKIGQKPSKVVFTGGGVYSVGLIDYFKRFPTPVYIGNPLRSLIIDPQMLPVISPLANQLSTSIGLALWQA